MTYVPIDFQQATSDGSREAFYGLPMTALTFSANIVLPVGYVVVELIRTVGQTTSGVAHMAIESFRSPPIN